MSHRACVLAGVILLLAPRAQAFTIASGFSHGCHESITIQAFDNFLLEIPTAGIVVSPGLVWREVAVFLRDEFPTVIDTDLDPEKMDEAQRFMFVSLLVGVRAPDTDGHSVLNLSELRQQHSDPSAQGQYAHSLRGPADDLQGGDAIAVAGARDTIRDLALLAIDYYQRPKEEQVIYGQFYLDFYGRIDVEVWAPMYYLGRAAHALQDSFAHAIRSEEDDFRKIVHVMNYVDAISAEFDEHRDGLAHSDSMDDCTGDETSQGTVLAAVDATIDLFYSARSGFTNQDVGAVNSLLDYWVTLKPDCTIEDEFCGNGRWLSVVREHQTRPYFQAIFGCESATSSRSLPGSTLCLLCVCLCLLYAGRTKAPSSCRGEG